MSRILFLKGLGVIYIKQYCHKTYDLSGQFIFLTIYQYDLSIVLRYSKKKDQDWINMQ